MSCQPTAAPDLTDIAALRERYRRERDKRLRPDAGEQYAQAAGALEEFAEADPHTPLAPREWREGRHGGAGTHPGGGRPGGAPAGDSRRSGRQYAGASSAAANRAED